MATTGVKSSTSNQPLEFTADQVKKVAKGELFVVETHDGARKRTFLAVAFAGAVFTFPAETVGEMRPAPQAIKDKILASAGK